METCASCHTLKAVNARGVTGPEPRRRHRPTPEKRKQSEARVLEAIKNGGTGQRRMPANLVAGEDAEDVAAYVADVAGR